MTNLEILRPVFRVLVTAFSTTHIIMGIASLPNLELLWPCLVALFLCAVASIFVAFGRRDSLNLHRTEAYAVICATTLMAILVNLGLPDGFPGYGWWNAGATEMILVALALRGQLPLAWTGLVAFAVAQAVGGTLNKVGAMEIFGSILTPALWVFFAAVIRWQIERNRQQIQVSEAKGRAVYQQQAAEYAYRTVKEQWTRVLDERVRWTLLDIDAHAENLTDAQRQEYALLELELRDEIQARIFMTDVLREAVRSARRAGLSVEFNDIRKVPLEPELSALIEHELMRLLSQPTVYRMLTVLALPKDSEVAVTILARAHGDGIPEQIDIPS
ncbi:hypothetical protein [Glutamicibacter arilaitensis]|uniref:hypothetical protein n=1 Tax=Glutamicibacter arilaitensis TaxID=256701 RepID=UPI00384E48B6